MQNQTSWDIFSISYWYWNIFVLFDIDYYYVVYLYVWYSNVRHFLCLVTVGDLHEQVPRERYLKVIRNAAESW